jgi:hypothetical protein
MPDKAKTSQPRAMRRAKLPTSEDPSAQVAHVFGTHRTAYATRKSAMYDIARWIELRYNRSRLHSKLRYRTSQEVLNEYLSGQGNSVKYPLIPCPENAGPAQRVSESFPELAQAVLEHAQPDRIGTVRSKQYLLGRQSACGVGARLVSEAVHYLCDRLH